MTTDPNDPLEATARLENIALRERVAELEQQLKDSVEHAVAAALAERESLLNGAERIAHMGSWVWDVATDEVRWSDELHRILGYDPATHRPSIESYFARVHPDDLGWVQERVAHGLKSGASEQLEYRVLRPDGSTRYVKVVVALPMDAAGTLKRAVGTVLDVTEARIAADELSRTAELLAEAQRIGKMGSFEVRLEDQTVIWSEELYRILDFDPSGTPTIGAIIERLHQDDRERIAELIKRAMTAGQVEPTRARLVHRDASVHHVDMMAVAILNERGLPRLIRGTVTDVTALVRLEAQFHQSQKMEAVGQLAGGLAHDYNNLLMVISGNAELLRKHSDCAELREILDAAKSATALTNRLLAFSRRTPQHARAAWLTEEIDESITLVQRALGSKIVTHLEHGPDLWPVYVDNGQIQQMLLNLALNARDAMPYGGEFTLRTRNAQLTTDEVSLHGIPPGNYVALSVADTGIGMDEVTRSRAFEPFYTTKTEGRGTGLGLAMVFAAMKQCGGFVHLHSSPGVGSTFELWFPRAAQDPPKAIERIDRPMRLRARVLLVDDNSSICTVIKRLLAGAGCTVQIVSDPLEALAIWRASPADVLVTDVEMPSMSGVELSERLRETTPELRTLFITGHSSERLDLQVRSGRCSVVMKPFRADELVRALASLLEYPVDTTC